MTPSLLDDIGLERVAALAREAAHDAIAEAHAHGLPVTLGRQDGAIVKRFPDGHEEVVKPASSACGRAS